MSLPKLAELPDFFDCHFKVVKEQLAIDLLSEKLPQITKKKLKLTMQYGAVWLTQGNSTKRIRRAKKQLSVGSEIHFYYHPKRLFESIKPAILIADENDYSVWDKPSGMFSQGTKWGDHSSIARWVELFGLEHNQIAQKPCFLVHRLDRATRGLILIAHSQQAVKALAHLFENRQIKKRYQAKVKGDFPNEHLLKAITQLIDGKNSFTLVLEKNYDSIADQTDLLIEIKTGRKHQIRKHLAILDFPILGDRLYGSDRLDLDLQLTASHLDFICPMSERSRHYSLE